MTGKEALEYIIKLVLSHTSTGRHSGKSYTNKALYKLSEELELLAKYKKTFEILKRELNIQIFYEDDEYFCNKMWILDGGGNKEITKEEYELLEEVMKDENC